MTNILPPNATLQERTITASIDYPINPNLIRGFKYDPTDAVLPWLIWEYGLGEIAKWVKDPQLLLQEGLQFQRLKGTPAGLQLALSWIYDGHIIVEEETPGPHFAEFQVGLQDVPHDFLTDALVALSTCAAPARSKLMRLYNDRYDVRRLILDDCAFGHILSDYSGVRLEADGPKLSFGRGQNYALTIGDVCAKLFTDHNLTTHVASADIYRLDTAVLSETPAHVCNHNGINWRNHFDQNHDDLAQQLDHLKFYAFSKAQIVLSNSWPLGDVNSCFGVTALQIIGDTFCLGIDQLSEHVWQAKSPNYTEREVQSHQTTALCQRLTQVQSFGNRKNTLACFVGMMNFHPSAKITNTYFKADYPGPITWHQHRHLNQPWRDQQFLMKGI